MTDKQQIKREYKKNFKSEKYIRLKKSYDEKLRKSSIAYLEKHVRSIKEDDPGKAVKHTGALRRWPHSQVTAQKMTHSNYYHI